MPPVFKNKFPKSIFPGGRMIHNNNLQLTPKFDCVINNKLINSINLIQISFLFIMFRRKVDL